MPLDDGPVLFRFPFRSAYRVTPSPLFGLPLGRRPAYRTFSPASNRFSRTVSGQKKMAEPTFIGPTKLGYQDSNLEQLNQNQSCCRLHHTPQAFTAPAGRSHFRKLTGPR